MGLLDSIIGGGGGFGSADEALRNNRALLNSIATPEYEQYSPELYNTESAKYDLINEDPGLKSKQLDALSQMLGLSHDGLSDQDTAGFAEARNLGDQMAKSKTDAAIQDAQVKGVSGGGQEFAMREAANQEAAQRAQQAALQQQATRAQQRNQYLQAYAGQLNTTKSQADNLNSANTNIINQFNQANTAQKNQTANANTDQRNNAFKYNEGLKDKNFSNQMTKATGQIDMNNQAAKNATAEAEYQRQQNGALLGLAGTGLGAWAGGPGNRAVGALIGGQVGKSL